jgi:S1-C subfamily serine protease
MDLLLAQTGPRLNALDVLLLAMLAFSLYRGFRQGALSQIAAFGGAGLGLVIGALLAPRVAGAMVGQPGSGLALVTLGLLLVLVFLGQGIGFGIGLRLRRAAINAGVGALDRVAGMAVGAAGLVLVVWLLGAVLSQGPMPVIAQQVRESRMTTFMDEALPPPPDVFGRVAGYLDQQGFPQVFSGLGGGITAPPVPPTSDAAVQAAAAAGQPSTVQVQATGCGGISSGSGFVVSPGFVVTNAHVVAGGSDMVVRDAAGEWAAVPVHFDPDLDLAVLASPDTQAPAIGWAGAPADRETEGATLGFPGGQRDMVVKPATVRGRGEAVGRDIYGRGVAAREILTLTAGVQRGDSGGPFVTSEGLVGGVVFAANAAEPGTGYALTAERVRPDIDAAMARNTPTGVGDCRF